jgi:hypothetical protein
MEDQTNQMITQINDQIFNESSKGPVDKVLKEEMIKIRDLSKNIDDEEELSDMELAFEKIYKKVSESNLDILDNLSKLRNSGMYIKTYYDNLLILSKETNIEDDVKELHKYIRNMKNISLEVILDLKGEIFDGEVANYIIKKISGLNQKRKQLKYTRMLHAKILYMIAADELEDEEKAYLSSLLLQNYYADLNPSK